VTAAPEEKALALAEHYLSVGQPDRALATLASQSDLQDIRLWTLRAQALYDLDQDAEAADAAREGLRIDAESIWLLDLLCGAELQLGHLEAAEEAILTALRLESEDPHLLSRYAYVLLRAGEHGKAGRVLAEAERVDADDPIVIRCRITYEYVRGNDAAVERHSRRLLDEFDPEDPFGHAMLGVRALNRGQFRKASQHHDTAARHDLTDEYAVETARESRMLTNPLFWPLAPFQRFGPGPVWIAGIGLVLGLRALDYDMLAGIALVSYLLLCAYSWIVPPLVERWYERRSG
jgi:tetratricopeptide (TPR) repeat protein